MQSLPPDAASRGATIGVFSGYVAGAYEGPIIAAISKVVTARGGRVLAVQTAGSGREYHQGVTLTDLARVGWEHMDGMISVANAVPTRYLQAFQATGKPVVAIANRDPQLLCPTIVADNVGGVTRVVEHLIEHGHTRIGFLGWLEQYDILERFGAYEETLRAHGIQPDRSLVFRARNNFEHGALPGAQALLEAGVPCSAVVAATDPNAVGLVRAVEAAGLRVPDDLAVTGFDDDADCALLSPSISTVFQDMAGLGTKAADFVLRALAGDAQTPGAYSIATRFIPRESCGCADTAAPPLGGGDPVDAFVATVAGQVVGGEDVEGLARRMQAVYAQAAAADVGRQEFQELGRACRQLAGFWPPGSARDLILSLALGLHAHFDASAPPGLGEGERTGRERQERLEACTAQVRLTLTKLQLSARNDAYYTLRKAIRDDYQITLDLLGTQDARLLEWLETTDALAAALALWPDGPPPGSSLGDGGVPAARIEVVGTYAERATSPAGTVHRLGSVEAFPPVDLLAADPGATVYVFPLRSPQRDWGFLAIAQPAGPRLEQEAYFTWSALFSQALDHRALLRSLEESKERYTLVARAANDGLWDWDLSRSSVYTSERWWQMLGLDPAGSGHAIDRWLACVHPDDRDTFAAELCDLRGGSCDSILVEHRVELPEGGHRWLLCRALAVPGAGSPATRIVGSITDVTERKELEERLRQEALYDALTGLANRSLLLDRLDQALAGSARNGRALHAVLWLDLDHFKQLNDTRGHLAGDRVLAEVAARIRATIRDGDTAARLGGDEFVVLLRDLDSREQSEVVAARLSLRLAEPHLLDGDPAVITASIGVTLVEAADTAEEVLRRADAAMYQAKARGRGSTVMDGPTACDSSRRRGATASPKG
jgi:diguanylate cyclase (GGDEF)-like protein/PAS domain S-box-containing protein